MQLSHFLGIDRTRRKSAVSLLTAYDRTGEEHDEKEFDPRTRWRNAIFKIKFQIATQGLKPMFPVERIQELKKYFLQRPVKDGEEIGVDSPLRELTCHEFIEIFSKELKNRQYSQTQLIQWFQDMDADVSNTLSWDELTSYLITQSQQSADTNKRAKEFVPEQFHPPPLASQHKDLVKRIALNENCPFVVTGAPDGLVKLWNGRTGDNIATIENSHLSAANAHMAPGSSVPIAPITDVVFHPRGTHCFVSAADGSINMYNSKNFEITRKYLGVRESSLTEGMLSNLKSAGTIVNNSIASIRGNSKKHSTGSVESAALLKMDGHPTSMCVATPLDRELFFLGQNTGEILIYSTLRHSMIPDTLPVSVFTNIHTTMISKIRYTQNLSSLVSCSWDGFIKLVDPQTGDVLSVLGSGAKTPGRDPAPTHLGHQKSVLDFSYSKSTRVLASCGGDREIFLWNPIVSLPLASLRGHQAPLLSVCFDEPDNLLVSLDRENVVKIWDLRMNHCVQTLGAHKKGNVEAMDHGGGPPSDRFGSMTLDTCTGKIMCAGNYLTCWTIRRAQLGFPASYVGHIDMLLTICSIPHTSTMYTADNDLIIAWTSHSGKRLAVFQVNYHKEPDAPSSPLVAVCRDTAQRKLIVARANADVQMYNARNGQLLREFKSGGAASEAIRVSEIGSLDGSIKYIAVLTAQKVIFYNALPNPETGHFAKSWEFDYVLPYPTDTFCTIVVYPTVGVGTVPQIILGTTEGRLLCYNAVTRKELACCAHPNVSMKRRASVHLDTFASSESSNLKPKGTAVEDIVYLTTYDLFATCTGTNSIFFWDMRNFVLISRFVSTACPQESILSIAVEDLVPRTTEDSSARCKRASTVLNGFRKSSIWKPRGNQYLIAGCEWGFVYVYALQQKLVESELPFSLVPITVFRAHNSGASITRLIFLADKELIITLSAVDNMVKCFTLVGKYVGYYGQKNPWKFRHESTYGQGAEGEPFSDDKLVTPTISHQTERPVPQNLPPLNNSSVTFLTSLTQATFGQESPQPSLEQRSSMTDQIWRSKPVKQLPRGVPFNLPFASPGMFRQLPPIRSPNNLPSELQSSLRPARQKKEIEPRSASGHLSAVTVDNDSQSKETVERHGSPVRFSSTPLPEGIVKESDCLVFQRLVSLQQLASRTQEKEQRTALQTSLTGAIRKDPQGWTSRPSSLLRVFDVDLDQIKRAHEVLMFPTAHGKSRTRTKL